MEHESHLPEQSSIAVKIFGWAVAAVIIGGVLYVVYTKSGLNPAIDLANAYDDCKSGIQADMAKWEKVEFLNTPENTEVIQGKDSMTLVMKLRINDRGQIRTEDYSCSAPKPHGGLHVIGDFFH